MDIQFYEPQTFRTQHKSNRQASNPEDLINPMLFSGEYADDDTCAKFVKEHHKQCFAFYNNLINAGVCREQARGVLPQNMYTEYYGTTNLNNLMKFVDLRTHDGAQWEIQKVAEACLDIAEELFPITVGEYRKIKNA